MKKMFLLLASLSLVSTMAFAQDDYDYGDSYGTEEAASTPDEGSYESSAPAAAEQPASDVEYKSMDDESKKTSRDESPTSPFFSRPFNMAAHVAVGFGSFWAVPEQ